MGIEAVKDSCLINNEGWICYSDKSLQGVDMAEEFYEKAWQGECESTTAQW